MASFRRRAEPVKLLQWIREELPRFPGSDGFRWKTVEDKTHYRNERRGKCLLWKEVFQIGGPDNNRAVGWKRGVFFKR